MNTNWNNYYTGYVSESISTTTTATATANDVLTNKIKFNTEEQFNKSLSKQVPVISKIKHIINMIVDYKIINNIVVIVYFNDNTKEKATCVGEDTFNLENAIMICILKKYFKGSKNYNDIRKNALKKINSIDIKKQKDLEESERIANKKAKYAERQAKRKAKRRQEQIDIQAEAFIKAMRMYDEEGVNQNKAAFDAEMERLSYMDNSNPENVN